MCVVLSFCADCGKLGIVRCFAVFVQTVGNRVLRVVLPFCAVYGKSGIVRCSAVLCRLWETGFCVLFCRFCAGCGKLGHARCFVARSRKVKGVQKQFLPLLSGAKILFGASLDFPHAAGCKAVPTGAGWEARTDDTPRRPCNYNLPRHSLTLCRSVTFPASGGE